MAMPGHNGGPPIEEEAPKLRWVKVNIAEAIEGMEGLSMEERGFCWTGWLKMYARMGGFPADDQVGARIMGCDVRLYRRLKIALVSGGKFYVDDGLLRNSRVEREIADFCREHRRRRDAALEREARRRLQVRSGELPGEVSETSGRLLGEVSNMFTAPSSELSEKSAKKPNENNACTATTVAQSRHSSGGTRTKNQNQEPEREETTTTREHDEDVGSGGDLAALNGTAIDLIRFIGKHAMVEQDIARNMLASNVKAFTADAMIEAYSVTMAEMAGGMIVKPYKYLIQTAKRIKEGMSTRREKPAVRDDRRERIRRIAEETEASIRGGRRP